MFENLQERLQRTFKSLRGQAVLNEENMQETMRELRLALLEADVNFKVVKQEMKAQIYQGEVGEANTATVEKLAKEARREAINSGCDVLIVDTAGRLHIDDQLMDEMQSLKRLLNPSEILFVADAMTGQDAVRSADEFHKKLNLTGVVLTKMDGDARGGAALSIPHCTGAPVYFLGVR